MSAEMFDMVGTVCRKLRGGTAPFGGLQVVLVGDFFQLPPITPRGDDEAVQGVLHAAAGRRPVFAFAASLWSGLKVAVCYLSEQHRQEDTVFLELLSSIRRRAVTAAHREALLAQNAGSTPSRDGVTQLFSHNADVDRINEMKLGGLPEAAEVFHMTSRGPKALVLQLARGCLSPERLHLKVGASVMFTKNNFAEGFVNGTLGVVTEFSEENGYPIITTHEGRHIVAEPMEWSIEEGGQPLARITQVPLRLAWAITVHKSQGMSLDAAHMDLSDAFEYGQGYVALSRVRTLAGLSLAGFNERALEVHPDVEAADRTFRETSSAVREAFAAVPSDELEAMRRTFLHACGGKEGEGSRGAATRQRGTYPPPKRNERRWEKTLELLQAGKTIAEVAEIRGRSTGTIFKHLEAIQELGKLPLSDIQHLALGHEDAMDEILAAFRKLDAKRLKPIYEFLSARHSYETIRLAQLLLRAEDDHT